MQRSYLTSEGKVPGGPERQASCSKRVANKEDLEDSPVWTERNFSRDAEPWRFQGPRCCLTVVPLATRCNFVVMFV